jgi:hypothetical protein
MANRRFIDFPIASTVNDNDIVLIWQDGLNKQTTKGTLIQGAPTSLEGLTDVDIAGLINGQILQYNSTTGKWENVDRTDINLSQLGDVSIVSPSDGQVLVYNSSTSKWENSSGGYVPYVGAVTTVDLGAQTIEAGSFVKAGGTSAQFLKADGSVDSSTYGTGTVTSVALTMPTAFSVAGSPITTAGTLAVTATGTTAQYIRGDGSLATFPALTGFVPYTGATADVNLGTHDLTAERGTFQNNGSSDTLTINHTSGSGYGIIVTKGGANEALYVSKTSGSGNAMTVVGGRTSLVDLALSSVTNTAGDFLTLSGGVVHKRTAAETLTDIGAQAALTNPVTGTGTTNYLPKFTGASTIGNSLVFDDGTNVGINTASPEGKLTVVGTSAQPPTSGTTANSLLQLKGSLNNELNIGSNTVAGNYGAYIQASDNNLAVPYQLNLQPNGGNVIIGGYTDSGYKLDVNGTGRFSGNLYINDNSIFGLRTSTNEYSIQYRDLDFRLIGSSDSGTQRLFSFGYYTSNNIAGTWNSKATINSYTGAATFSSSVTAGGDIRSNAIFRDYQGEALIQTSGNDTQIGSFGAGTPRTISLIAGNDRRLFITTGGNVGIGTSSPSSPLHVVNSSNGFIYRFAGGTSSAITGGIFAEIGRNFASIGTTSNHGFNIFTNDLDRLAITSSGNVLIGTTTLIAAAGNAISQKVQSNNNWVDYAANSASSGAIFGYYSHFSNQSPNNSGSAFFLGGDNSAERIRIYSNGGIANFQANNVNLSDIRTKKEIKPLESYWDKFKDIEIVKFKYKDQTHDDYNIGVIAQQVEQVAPEFVDIDGWGENIENEEPLKSIYTADLHHATIKVLQEAMQKIEALQKEIDTLKNN